MGSETDNIANKAKKFLSFDGIVNLKTSSKPLRDCSKVITSLDCTGIGHLASTVQSGYHF